MLDTLVSIVVALGGALFDPTTQAPAVEPEAQRPAQLLVLDGLPGQPPLFADAASAQTVAAVPELDPRRAWPQGGDTLAAGPKGELGWRLASTPSG